MCQAKLPKVKSFQYHLTLLTRFIDSILMSEKLNTQQKLFRHGKVKPSDKKKLIV
jgi:hypothetical protein